MRLMHGYVAVRAQPLAAALRNDHSAAPHSQGDLVTAARHPASQGHRTNRIAPHRRPLAHGCGRPGSP
jgi:hypothetical protein